MSTGGDAVRPRAVNPWSAIALAIVATLGALYFVSQFIRNSIGVIAPNLATEMALTPLDLGFLSSIYFFVFAAIQIPLGVALDRFGPKLCMLVCVAFTVLGCAMFAAAQSRRQPRGRAGAARLRHGVVPDGAMRALCALVPAGAVLDVHRHPSRSRHAWRVAGDRAARICHRGGWLARDVSRHRRSARR